MSEKKFDAQINYGWGLTFSMSGKAPVINKRIFDKLSDAQAFADDYNDSAIEGLILSVVADDNEKNNGIYFVERIKKSADDKDSSLIKVGSNEASAVETYSEAIDLATNDSIGQVIYVKTKSSYDADGEGDSEAVEYEAGPYIVIGEKSLMKLAASSASGDIEGEIIELKNKINTTERDIDSLESVVGNSESGLVKNVNVLQANDESLQSEINSLKEKNDSLIPNDIIVAGLDSKLGAGNYNNNDVIPAGTDMYEILQNILCKELFPTNVTTTVASATASMNNLILSLDKSNTIEVGTLVKLISGSTNGSVVNKVNSKISNIEYGYSTQNNNTKESSDKSIEKECTTEISDNEYTIFASIISGFTADTETNIKTTPETKTGEGSASLVETKLGCVIEGDNKITINAIGASYSYSANAIDKIYYCSNLGKTSENQYHEGIGSVSGTTEKPTNSTSAIVKGRYKYFLGYSDNTSFDQFNSDSIRALTVKSNWLNLDSTTEVVGGTYTSSDGTSIVIACPTKYKLSSIENSLGSSILGNFSSSGVVAVKTGEINTDYNVYVYPITNGTVIDFKNVKIAKN